MSSAGTTKPVTPSSTISARTTPVVRDHRNADRHCLDRHVAECLDPLGCHHQRSTGAQLRLQVVGRQEPLVIEVRPWVVGLDPTPVLLVLEHSPDEHTLAGPSRQLSDILQALLRRNPTDEAEWSVVSARSTERRTAPPQCRCRRPGRYSGSGNVAACAALWTARRPGRSRSTSVITWSIASLSEPIDTTWSTGTSKNCVR